MVKEGKLTRAQLNRVKRVQSAQSNSIEHFGFFMGSMVSFVFLPLISISFCCWAFWEGGDQGEMMEN